MTSLYENEQNQEKLLKQSPVSSRSHSISRSLVFLYLDRTDCIYFLFLKYFIRIPRLKFAKFYYYYYYYYSQ